MLSPLNPVRPASAIFRVEVLAAKPIAKQFGVRAISKTKRDVIGLIAPHAVATRGERKTATEFALDIVVLTCDLIGTYGDLIRPVTIDFAARQFTLSSSHRKPASRARKSSRTSPRPLKPRVAELANCRDCPAALASVHRLPLPMRQQPTLTSLAADFLRRPTDENRDIIFHCKLL